jgi:hypothetical protein
LIEREHNRKDPRHLLMMPFVFGIAGVACYSLVYLTCQSKDGGFSAYSDPSKTLIVIPFLLASIPIGLMGANLLAWSIPPIRRFFDGDAQGRPNGSFGDSMRGLLLFAMFWSGLFLIFGVGAAYFGR